MDGLALLTKAAAVTTPAVITEDDDDECSPERRCGGRDGTDGPGRRANATRKRPAAVVETGPAAARAAAEAAFGLARGRREVKAPAHARATCPSGELGRGPPARAAAPARAARRPAARVRRDRRRRAVNAKESSVAHNPRAQARPSPSR